MTFLELYRKVQTCSRPTMAMNIIFCLIDNCDKEKSNELLSRNHLTDLVMPADASRTSYEKNLGRTAKELGNMGLIITRYRDADGELQSDVSRNKNSAIYQLSEEVLCCFGRAEYTAK